MQIIPYNKLVRDNIPEIIRSSGKSCSTEIMSDEEYLRSLNAKLLEEVNEYLDSGDIEELADISEVIRAILDYNKISVEEFEPIRLEKLKARGGFLKRILLKEVQEQVTI